MEPNNLVQSLTRSSISSNDSVDEILDHVKYALLFERGKKALGQGDNSLGDLVPGMLAQADFENIDVRMSDKAIAMYPPTTPRRSAPLSSSGARATAGPPMNSVIMTISKPWARILLNFMKTTSATMPT